VALQVGQSSSQIGLGPGVRVPDPSLGTGISDAMGTVQRSGFYESGPGRVLESHAGDVCSALGVAGAAMLFASHRTPRLAHLEQYGQYSVMGSISWGGIDTAIQGSNYLHDRGASSAERGRESNPGSIAYAATGLIPAVALRPALRNVAMLGANPGRASAAKIAVLGLNAGVLGYETITRTPRILAGEENLSGYGSFAAAGGGFIVAHHAFRTPHTVQKIAQITHFLHR
jgi:hypothetical protein